MIDAANHPYPHRRLRSFVRRNSRKTSSQRRAYETLVPSFGLQVASGLLDLSKVFGRSAPCFLEIGFGSGQSLLALAKEKPEYDFVAVETHRPGIGSLLIGIEQAGLSNIRIYDADVVDVLARCIPDESLAGAQIFFPDPWPKRRQQVRRLVQQPFMQVLVAKLKEGAKLHLATDWEDYAKQMVQVLSSMPTLQNVAGADVFSARSPHRPVLTKFERRAISEGRAIWDLQYVVL